MTRLLLASASARRHALLAAAGRPPDAVVPTAVDETPHPREGARDLVRRLATAKRDAACDLRGGRAADAVVLAADTVVALDDDVLGKPVDEDDARRMLLALAGRVATVWSGVAVGGGATGGDRGATAVRTSVRFGHHDRTTVDAYVATGEPMGAAGAFRLQGRGAQLVLGTDGCPTNVVGLPVCETAGLLAPSGIALDTDCDAVLARLRATGRV